MLSYDTEIMKIVKRRHHFAVIGISFNVKRQGVAESLSLPFCPYNYTSGIYTR